MLCHLAGVEVLFTAASEASAVNAPVHVYDLQVQLTKLNQLGHSLNQGANMPGENVRRKQSVRVYMLN